MDRRMISSRPHLTPRAMSAIQRAYSAGQAAPRDPDAAKGRGMILGALVSEGLVSAVWPRDVSEEA